MPKRRDRFVVGFPGEGNSIYGRDVAAAASFIEPMERLEAQRMITDGMESEGAVLYELVRADKRPSDE